MRAGWGLVLLPIILAGCDQFNLNSPELKHHSSLTLDSQLAQEVQDVLLNSLPAGGTAIDLEGALSPRPHPLAAAEQWDVLLALQNSLGHALGVQSQISRISVKSSEDINQSSNWAFTDVMVARQGVSRESIGADEKGFEFSFDVQRVANELAGTDENGRVWVSSHELNFISEAPCTHRAALRGGSVEALTFTVSDCAAISHAPGVTSLTYRIDGHLSGDTDYSGKGWLVHSWGRIPQAGGAVVFDRAWLSIDGIGDVQLLRRKRRSGHGPVRTTAIITESATNDQPPPTDLLVELTDGDYYLHESGASPGDWTLDIKDMALSVSLNAVIHNNPSTPVEGLPWRRLVRVNGTHTGMGFIEYNPVSKTSGP